uniref:MIP34243p1 n=1 Tax=Drosophila melanogaster TaxID=7227 RepID=H1UUD5_DROME|nr:MIP34243p1 [Drosophila melanogaster]
MSCGTANDIYKSPNSINCGEERQTGATLRNRKDKCSLGLWIYILNYWQINCKKS